MLEDDEDIRTIIEAMLEEEEYDIKSYGEAKRLLQDIPKTNADLFLLDVRLPDGNGIEICNWLKANTLTNHIQ